MLNFSKSDEETTSYTSWMAYGLACALLKSSSNVVLFDVRPPSQELPEGIVFMRADIRDYTQVEKAVRGMNCVFDIASYGMSGREQLVRKLIEEVNVQGTENFEFFRPLVEGLGYSFPTLRLPISLIYVFAFLTEMLHHVVGRIYNFQPLLTRTEVYKTGITHYFSMRKAREELGYEPKLYDLEDVVQWFRDRGHGKKRSQSSVKELILDVVLVVAFAAVVLSCLLVVGQ